MSPRTPKPDPVSAYLAKIGARGGRAASGPTKAAGISAYWADVRAGKRPAPKHKKK